MGRKSVHACIFSEPLNNESIAQPFSHRMIRIGNRMLVETIVGWRENQNIAAATTTSTLGTWACNQSLGALSRALSQLHLQVGARTMRETLERCSILPFLCIRLTVSLLHKSRQKLINRTVITKTNLVYGRTGSKP